MTKNTKTLMLIVNIVLLLAVCISCSSSTGNTPAYHQNNSGDSDKTQASSNTTALNGANESSAEDATSVGGSGEGSVGASGDASVRTSGEGSFGTSGGASGGASGEVSTQQVDLSSASSNGTQGKDSNSSGFVNGTGGNTSENHSEPSAADSKESIKILAVGDLLIHIGLINSALNQATGAYDFEPYFEYVKPYIEQADFAIANFEGTAAGKAAKYTGYPNFNAPDEILPQLKNIGFDLLVTSNNHCLDRKKAGLLKTIEQIRENQMLQVGTNASPEESRFRTIEIKGFKISILAYTFSCNGHEAELSKEDAYLVNMIDEKKIKKDIEEAKAFGSDAVIAYMHWGKEYHRSPSNAQVTLANKMLDWGVDIIFGNHPHVIQPSEMVHVNGRDCYIIYSIGNFLANMKREDDLTNENRLYAEDGVMVTIELEKDFATGKTHIKAVTHTPTWVDRYSVNNALDFRILPLKDELFGEDYFNDTNRQKASESYKNTFDMVKDYNSLQIEFDNKPNY